MDWARYWRAPDRPLEAMHAHFAEHVYHRHSHDTYSFGVTDEGAQAFTCRGAARTSVAGMVMAFNPDEPHDGHAATEQGFTYRIVHIGPDLVSQALDDAGLPLFVEPVMHDPVLAEALRCLHNALRGGTGLARDEALDRTIRALVRRGATRVPPLARQNPGVAKVREFLHDNHSVDVRADTLAAIAGGSRYAMYRGFIKQYGMPPSDYQRQLRMRTARQLITQGVPIADSAVSAGFADQSHFTRWFQRYYGITPGAFRDAV